MACKHVLLATIVVAAAVSQCNSYAPSSKLFGNAHNKRIKKQQSFNYPVLRSSATTNAEATQNEASNLKTILLERLTNLRQLQKEDGDISIDFGVKGGELNETSRAPQKVNFYGTSERVGKAADDILEICNSLSAVNPSHEPLKYLGNREKGTLSPINGEWRQLFTTAADASFSANSTRGDASVKNIVDASKSRITNVIDFATRPDGSEPALKQLNVVIGASAIGSNRVGLQFRYAKIVLTKFFVFPLFGRTLTVYIPVPALFITRIIVFLSRIVRLGRRGAKKVPKAYFDVLYLDDDLRIHRTSEDNLFVQASNGWDAAKPLLKTA